MPLTSINYTLTSTNRIDIRKEITNEFLKEQAGTGKANLCSRYHYTVETFSNLSVVLKRPTGLNKGFDFTVNVDGFYFKKNRRYTNPSHDDILKILNDVKNTQGVKYSLIASHINDIFNCQSVNLNNLAGITFFDFLNSPQPIDIILLVIKWLFIEQDITYWNWSGRHMLYEKLKNENLC